MSNATPIETEEEQTKPEPALTNAELVFCKTNRADFAEDDRWADPNDPQDHGQTEAQFRWLHGPMVLLLVLLLGVAACGGELPPESTASAEALPPCTDVGAAQNCVYSPGHNGPSPTITCQSNRDGLIVPVVGCTLDLLASPGVPYTATCVEVCP